LVNVRNLLMFPAALYSEAESTAEPTKSEKEKKGM
jgi:hypothetical protein